MAHDRGSIKWTTMMLPEHAELLKELWEEDDYQEKPLLDIQQIEQLERDILIACHKHLSVELTIYQAKRRKTVQGYIKKLDQKKKCLYLADDAGDEIILPFHQITDLTHKK